MSSAAVSKIAVLSDTHGLLRPEVLIACRGADAILHAGDVGNFAILDQLRQVAPVTAIRGNIDTTGACASLPPSEMVVFGATCLYLVHDLSALDINPAAAGVDVLIYGHSHKPTLERRANVLYLNPGSVGPRRFKLPISMAVLSLLGTQIDVEQLCFDT